MKRCKFRFFTSYDKNTWVNKADLISYIRKLRQTKGLKELLVEIEKCERI